MTNEEAPVRTIVVVFSRYQIENIPIAANPSARFTTHPCATRNERLRW